MRARRSRAVALHRRGTALQAAGRKTVLMAVRRVRVVDHPAAVQHRIQAEAPPAEAAGVLRIAAEVVVEVGAAAPMAGAVEAVAAATSD